MFGLDIPKMMEMLPQLQEQAAQVVDIFKAIQAEQKRQAEVLDEILSNQKTILSTLEKKDA